jgi:hypothetical protein
MNCNDLRRARQFLKGERGLKKILTNENSGCGKRYQSIHPIETVRGGAGERSREEI